MPEATTSAPPPWFVLAFVGLIGGFFAGIFGVGGGVVMVPLLLWWTTLDEKRAHATSLLAITPVAIVGATAYGIGGVFEWDIALIVAVGSVIGAPFGAWLLRSVSVAWIRWGFILFVLASATGLFLREPERTTTLEITLLTAILLFLLGLAMGTTSGLLGVGGGIIVVPALILGFGQSDLVAKGVSLLSMAPGSLSGSMSHLRHKTATLRDGAWVALGALVTTPLGAWAAFLLEPRAAAIVFAILLGVVALNLIAGAIRAHKKP